MTNTPEFWHREPYSGGMFSYGYSDHCIEYSVGDTEYMVIIRESDTGDYLMHIETDDNWNVLPPLPFQNEAIEWFFKEYLRHH